MHASFRRAPTYVIPASAHIRYSGERPHTSFRRTPESSIRSAGFTRIAPRSSRPWCHFRLKINAQTVGHPIDVVEIGDGLYRVVEGPVGQSNVAKHIKVSRRHGVWHVRQFDREIAQGAING